MRVQGFHQHLALQAVGSGRLCDSVNCSRCGKPLTSMPASGADAHCAACTIYLKYMPSVPDAAPTPQASGVRIFGAPEPLPSPEESAAEVARLRGLDPWQEFVGLQQLRAYTAPRERELQLSFGSTWVPAGVDVGTAVFQGGVLREARWVDETDPSDPRWTSVEVLTIGASSTAAPPGPSPLTGPLPVLRDVRHAHPAHAWELITHPPPRLAALHLRTTSTELQSLVTSLPGLSRLRALALSLGDEDGAGSLSPLLTARWPRLERLRLPTREAPLAEARARRPPRLTLELVAWVAGPGAAWIEVTSHLTRVVTRGLVPDDVVATLTQRVARAQGQAPVVDRDARAAPGLHGVAIEVRAGDVMARTGTPQPPRTSPSPVTGRERAHFDAVVAVPDDDARRLVLADALAERGEPRAELISLQIAEQFARLDPARAARVHELLGAHGERWVPVGVDPRRSRFRRGFLDDATWFAATNPHHPDWRLVKTLRCDPQLANVPASFVGFRLDWLETLLGAPPAVLLEATRTPLPRLTTLEGSLPHELARGFGSLGGLHTLGLHLFRPPFGAPPAADLAVGDLTALLDEVPRSLQRLRLLGHWTDARTLQATIARRAHQPVVELVAWQEPSAALGLEVLASGLQVRVKGTVPDTAWAPLRQRLQALGLASIAVQSDQGPMTLALP